MMKLLTKFSTTALAVSTSTLLSASAQEAIAKNIKSDIKPALAKDGFDKNEMHITKIIHQRIMAKMKAQKMANAGKTSFQTYQEITKAGAKFHMLPIKGGQFIWQGEQPDDSLDVTLSPFWMGKTEITWNEYRPFMEPKITRQRNGHPSDQLNKSLLNEIDLIARPTTQIYPVSKSMPQENHPAINMTQHAANKYCQWLSYQTGHFYRLPTEAEWEYACRADSKGKYSWGDDEKLASNFAWLDGSGDSHYNEPGQKKPNAWGLHDMPGNVLEWTLDQYVPNRQKYFGKKKVHNPWVKATKSYPHVAKGGHWKQSLKDIKASARHQSHPDWKFTDPQLPKRIWYHTDTEWIGFRIVRPLEVPTVEEMYHYWNSGVEEN